MIFKWNKLILKIFSHKLFLHKTIYVGLFIFTSLAFSALISSTIVSIASASDYSLTMNIVSRIELKVTPSSMEGTFVSSDTTTPNINIATTNYSGYTLGIFASDNNSNALENINDDTATIPSITTSVSQTNYENSSYAASNNLNNTWGYRLSKLDSANDTSYLAAPTSTSMTVLDQTSSANTTNNTYNIAIGSRVNLEQAPGIYTNKFVITAMANPVPYAIVYNTNAGSSTVENLPSTQSSSTLDNKVSLSNTIPTRSHYSFAGWCNNNSSETSCSHTPYQANNDYPINQTGSNNIALYAIWTPNIYTATVKVNSSGYGTVSSASVAKNYNSSIAINGNTITIGGTTVTATPTAATAQYTYAFSSWTNNCGSSLTANCTITANFTRTVNKYHLDLNGYLDGVSGGSISGYGTADIYINGALVSSGVTDFYQQFDYGATYEIKNIQATTSHVYNGVYSGSLSGTITGETSISLNFSTKPKYTVTWNSNGGIINGDQVSSGFSDGDAITLKAGVSVPLYTGLKSTISANQDYLVTFDYYSTNTATFDVDFYPDTLPQTWPTATTTKQTYKWRVNTSSADVRDSQLRFFNDTQVPNPYDIHIENIRLYKCNTLYSEVGPCEQTASISRFSNTNLGTLPTPKYPGYTFDGWYTSAIGGTKVTSATAVTENVTYYAHWQNVFDDAFANAGKTKQNGFYKMQDMTSSICAAIATPTSTTDTSTRLIDTRDNKVYWVSKLKDGNCWMTQNLALDLDNTKTLTKDDTNITSSSGWKPERATVLYGALTSSLWANVNNYVDPYSWNPGHYYILSGKTTSVCTSSDLSTCAGIENHALTTDTHYHIGNRYTWAAALASNNLGNSATTSICPKGWEIPPKTQMSTLANGLDTTTVRAAPYYFVQGGGVYKETTLVYEVGTYGLYWTRTPKETTSNTNALAFRFGSGDFFSVGESARRSRGYAIRCVAKN